MRNFLNRQSGVGNRDAVRPVLHRFAFVSVLLIFCPAAFAQLTAAHHPWGLFSPGSSCIVQTRIVTGIPGKKSTATVQTTLRSISKNSIVVEEKEEIDFCSQILQKEPVSRCFDFWNEEIVDNVRIKTGKPVNLTVDKKNVVCNIRIYEQQLSGAVQTTTVWWSEHFFPYILRKEKLLQANGAVVSTTVSAVTDVSGSKSKRSYTMQTIEKTGQTVKTTESIYSRNIPGSLVSSNTSETDKDGNEIRSSATRVKRYSYQLGGTQ